MFSGLLIINQLTEDLLRYTFFWIRLFTTILYYFLQYQQAEHSVYSQSFLWFIISINWPDTSFLQMIAGVQLNVRFSLSALSLKSQSVFNGNNRSFHMLISKLNLMITQIKLHQPNERFILSYYKSCLNRPLRLNS